MAFRLDKDTIYFVTLKDLSDPKAVSKDLRLSGARLDPLIKNDKLLITIKAMPTEPAVKKVYDPIDRNAGTNYKAAQAAAQAATA